MDVIWGWCWARFGRRYSWAVFAGVWATLFPVSTFAGWSLLRVEGSSRYGWTLVIVAAGSAVLALVVTFPGVRSGWGPVEGWAAGRPVLARVALESTYDFARRVRTRTFLLFPVGGAAVGSAMAMLAGAPSGRIFQWAFVSAVLYAALDLVSVHGYVEAFLRPVREAIAGDSDVGDDLPRAAPTFATWSTIALLATIVSFTIGGALFAVVVDVGERPILAVVIAFAMMIGFGIPITVTTSFGPSLRPIQELEAGARRVADGDYTVRVPVVQDDDLGVLSASFNRMQAGLAERARLQAAFGTYVDPSLAERLLAQNGDLFSGERVDVTVMFVDIRDFTPFAESHTAEETVAQLNALFEIVVNIVDDHGGHVNKFLGDGAMVIFGAPERHDDHADRAVTAAADIVHQTHAAFAGDVRIGVGINTGTVIAGTIGGSKKLEFTIIGDAVNVAARVEQLTKITGDTILLTQRTVDALTTPPSGMTDRGVHELKGKAEPVAVHALEPLAPVLS